LIILALAAAAGVCQGLLRELASAGFAPAKVAWINVLLSGDTAVVIAMACFKLPGWQRLWVIIVGAVVSVLLRIVFILFVAALMLLPWLKIVGGVLLFYMVAKQLAAADTADDKQLWRAVSIIATADVIMSLDNVIAVAAATQGSLALLVLGLRP
jgi:YjbE family integral membrane protein